MIHSRNLNTISRFPWFWYPFRAHLWFGYPFPAFFSSFSRVHVSGTASNGSNPRDGLPYFPGGGGGGRHCHWRLHAMYLMRENRPHKSTLQFTDEMIGLPQYMRSAAEMRMSIFLFFFFPDNLTGDYYRCRFVFMMGGGGWSVSYARERGDRAGEGVGYPLPW